MLCRLPRRATSSSQRCTRPTRSRRSTASSTSSPRISTHRSAARAGSLQGVVTQRLLPKIGGGRAPAIEIMLMTGRIKDCVLDQSKTLEIHDLIAESGFYGMQTFDQSLVSLFKDGLVTLEDARSASMSPTTSSSR